MSTFELDEDMVRNWLNSDPGVGDLSMCKALSEQLPVKAPTGLGAVVRLANGGLAIRGDRSDTPWRCLSAIANEFEGWYAGVDLPARITEVLSAGVEL